MHLIACTYVQLISIFGSNHRFSLNSSRCLSAGHLSWVWVCSSLVTGWAVATSHSAKCRKIKISTPGSRNSWTDLIELGKVDYFHNPTSHDNFHVVSVHRTLCEMSHICFFFHFIRGLRFVQWIIERSANTANDPAQPSSIRHCH